LIWGVRVVENRSAICGMTSQYYFVAPLFAGWHSNIALPCRNRRNGIPILLRCSAICGMAFQYCFVVPQSGKWHPHIGMRHCRLRLGHSRSPVRRAKRGGSDRLLGGDDHESGACRHRRLLPSAARSGEQSTQMPHLGLNQVKRRFFPRFPHFLSNKWAQRGHFAAPNITSEYSFASSEDSFVASEYSVVHLRRLLGRPNTHLEHLNLRSSHLNIQLWHPNIRLPHPNILLSHLNLRLWHLNIQLSHPNLQIWHLNIQTRHMNLRLRHWQTHLVQRRSPVRRAKRGGNKAVLGGRGAVPAGAARTVCDWSRWFRGARPPRAQWVAPSRTTGGTGINSPFGAFRCVRVRREGAPNNSRGGCAPNNQDIIPPEPPARVLFCARP